MAANSVISDRHFGSRFDELRLFKLDLVWRHVSTDTFTLTRQLGSRAPALELSHTTTYARTRRIYRQTTCLISLIRRQQ